MQDKRLQFLEALFDEGDLIAFGKDNKNSNKPVQQIPFFLNTQAEKFCINPLKEWRNTNNVTKIVSLLFEMDEGGISPKEQAKLILKSGLPFTTMVYSGGKSVHTIVRFEEPIEDTFWQREWWEAIARALKKYGFIADVRARLVVQLSRVPESIRENTGKKQSLMLIRERISFDSMKQWLEANGERVRNPKYPKPNTYEVGMNDHVSNVQKFKKALEWNENRNGVYSSYMETGAHNWLFNFAINCYKVDLSESATIALSQSKWGLRYTGTNGGGLVETVIKQGIKYAHNNSVKQYKIK